MSNYGYFSENPQTELISDSDNPDRNMQLLRDFSYTDPDGKVWIASSGDKINGASIPRPLWSTVGSPYTDNYRNASIIHDIAVDKGDRKAADKMFYYACLAGGCSKSQSRLLYLGVRLGSWGSKKKGFWKKLKSSNVLFRNKLQPPIKEEIELLEKFESISEKLNAMEDSDIFEKMEALLDAEIK